MSRIKVMSVEVYKNSQSDVMFIVNGHSFGYVTKNSAKGFRDDVSEFLAIIYRSHPTKSKGVSSIREGLMWLKNKYENG